MRRLMLSLWFVLAASQASGASLDSFAGVVAGPGNGSIVDNCTTYGPPAELAMFGSQAAAMSVLGGNAACAYSGGWSLTSAATGPHVNGASLGPTLLGNPGFSGFFDGTAEARSGYGSLGARAHGQFTLGLPGSPLALFASQSAAFFTDSFLASSVAIPNLSAGFVRYRFEIDGTLSALGAQASFYFGEAHAALMIQQQGGPIYQVFAAHVVRGSVPTVPSGFSGGLGTLSGSGTFESPMLPITWGQAFEFKAGLLAVAYGEADAAFYNSVKLAGIELFDANGAPVSNFSLTAQSGTNYVPEPESLALVAAAALCLGALRRTRDA